MLLPGLTSETVSALFSHNFMRCLVNSLNKDDTLLHAAASRCLSNVRPLAPPLSSPTTHSCTSQLLAFVKSDAGAPLQSAVIAALQRFAGGRFDKLTQTTAVSALMQGLAGDSAADYVQSLFISFLSADPEAAAAGGADGEAAEEAARALAGRRAWSVEQLCGAHPVQLRGCAAPFSPSPRRRLPQHPRPSPADERLSLPAPPPLL